MIAFLRSSRDTTASKQLQITHCLRPNTMIMCKKELRYYKKALPTPAPDAKWEENSNCNWGTITYSSAGFGMLHLPIARWTKNSNKTLTAKMRDSGMQSWLITAVTLIGLSAS